MGSIRLFGSERRSKVSKSIRHWHNPDVRDSETTSPAFTSPLYQIRIGKDVGRAKPRSSRQRSRSSNALKSKTQKDHDESVP